MKNGLTAQLVPPDGGVVAHYDITSTHRHALTDYALNTVLRDPP